MHNMVFHQKELHLVKEGFQFHNTVGNGEPAKHPHEPARPKRFYILGKGREDYPAGEDRQTDQSVVQ